MHVEGATIVYFTDEETEEERQVLELIFKFRPPDCRASL